MSDEIILSFDTGARGMMRTDWDIANNLATNIITVVENQNDPYYALDIIRILGRLQNASGLAKAQILYYLHENWNKFQINEDFFHVAMRYGFRNQVMIKRYIDIWAMFAEDKIPNEAVKQMKDKPINDLVPIMGALKQDYVIDTNQWIDLADLSTGPEIAEYVRTNIKKMQPRIQTILFRVDKSDSMLYAINQGKRYKVAKLNSDSNEEIVQTAIQKLLHALGVPDAV